MKSLYESILDDEEELIEKTTKTSLWIYIYELLKDKKENEAIKILNDTFKPFKSGQWLKWGSINGVERVLNFHKQGAMHHAISIRNVRDKRQLMFRFYNPIFHDSVKADVIKKDFYNSYKITYDDFKNKFKPNLIKELDLKQTDQLFDEWIMEL
jgi:hypothetical protein